MQSERIQRTYSGEIQVGNREKQAQAVKYLSVIAAYMMMILLLKWPETALQAAQRAMEQWYHGVAPTLFPFMMLTPLITSKEASYMYEKLFGRIMQMLFGLPGSAAPALIAGMLAGSPTGAAAAGQAAANSGMDRRQLIRLAGCVCGLSPAFMVNVIGMGMLDDAKAGMLLLRTQFITQMIMLAVTRKTKGEGRTIVTEGKEQGGATSTVLSVLNVAGYMVFFGIISAVFNNVIGGNAGKYLLCILEISGGSQVVADAGLAYRYKMVILAVICGFGGICICAQNMKILAKYGVRANEYILWRIAGAGVSGLVMLIQTQETRNIGMKFQVNWLELTSFFVIITAFPALIGIKKHIS